MGLSHHHLLLVGRTFTHPNRAMGSEMIQEIHITDIGRIVLCLSTPIRLFLHRIFHSVATSRNQIMLSTSSCLTTRCIVDLLITVAANIAKYLRFRSILH